MNQVPEKDILVRNQIQMYSKKISGQCNVTTRIEQVQDKKKITGQQRNTIKTYIFHITVGKNLILKYTSLSNKFMH
jgi:hypothetical protein